MRHSTSQHITAQHDATTLSALPNMTTSTPHFDGFTLSEPPYYYAARLVLQAQLGIKNYQGVGGWHI